MEGEPAIWVIASRESTGKRVEEVLENARLLNPVKLIQDEQELNRLTGCTPLLIFVDLGLNPALTWDVLDRFCSNGWQGHIIALVDDQSEALLDRAYEAGVKTYLRKDFTFADFLERVRVLDMRFNLGRDANSS